MAKIPRTRLHFEYSSDWESYIDTCPRCGWSGPLREGEREYFTDLMEIWCPKCIPADGGKLAIMSFPLIRPGR